MERFNNFAFDEVVNQGNLDGHTRFMAILAALLCSHKAFLIKIISSACLILVIPVRLMHFDV